VFHWCASFVLLRCQNTIGRLFASGRSLVRRSRTDCGVSYCGREASIRGGPRALGAVALWKTILYFCSICQYSVSALDCMAGHSNCKGAESFGRILSVAAARKFARRGRARLQTVIEQAVSFQDLNWRISESKTERCRLI
jgi:hypothetical protein